MRIGRRVAASPPPRPLPGFPPPGPHTLICDPPLGVLRAKDHRQLSPLRQPPDRERGGPRAPSGRAGGRAPRPWALVHHRRTARRGPPPHPTGLAPAVARGLCPPAAGGARPGRRGASPGATRGRSLPAAAPAPASSGRLQPGSTAHPHPERALPHRRPGGAMPPDAPCLSPPRPLQPPLPLRGSPSPRGHGGRPRRPTIRHAGQSSPCPNPAVKPNL